jgi:hypothetical protein
VRRIGDAGSLFLGRNLFIKDFDDSGEICDQGPGLRCLP